MAQGYGGGGDGIAGGERGQAFESCLGRYVVFVKTPTMEPSMSKYRPGPETRVARQPNNVAGPNRWLHFALSGRLLRRYLPPSRLSIVP